MGVLLYFSQSSHPFLNLYDWYFGFYDKITTFVRRIISNIFTQWKSLKKLHQNTYW